MPATKISVTLDEASLAWLRERAKKVHRGNLSAAISETTELARKQESLLRFLEGEGAPKPSASEMAEIAAEWTSPPKTRARRTPAHRSRRA